MKVGFIGAGAMGAPMIGRLAGAYPGNTLVHDINPEVSARVAGHSVAVAEAMGLCLETGVDVKTFFDIVTEGTGLAHSRYFENRVPSMRDGEYSALFMLRFLLKDIRLAHDMISDAETNYPNLSAAKKSFENSVDLGWSDADFPAVMKLVEARVGRTIAK